MAEWFRVAGEGAGLTIVLYPTDEFGAQELPEAEIPAFVSGYLPVDGDSVHLMRKVEVNGDDPVWLFLRHSFPGEIEWNFDGLFLLDQEGVPVGRYRASELGRRGGEDPHEQRRSVSVREPSPPRGRLDADLKYLLTQSGWL